LNGYIPPIKWRQISKKNKKREGKEKIDSCRMVKGNGLTFKRGAGNGKAALAEAEWENPKKKEFQSDNQTKRKYPKISPEKVASLPRSLGGGHFLAFTGARGVGKEEENLYEPVPVKKNTGFNDKKIRMLDKKEKKVITGGHISRIGGKGIKVDRYTNMLKNQMPRKAGRGFVGAASKPKLGSQKIKKRLEVLSD